jgi:hypothetical protein
MSIKLRYIAIAVALSWAGSANASMKVGDFLEMENDPQSRPYAALYIEAYMQALTVANGTLRFRGQTAFFCPPGTIALSGDNARNAVKTALKNGSAKESDDIGIILLKELQSAFPCQ